MSTEPFFLPLAAAFFLGFGASSSSRSITSCARAMRGAKALVPTVVVTTKTAPTRRLRNMNSLLHRDAALADSQFTVRAPHARANPKKPIRTDTYLLAGGRC